MVLREAFDPVRSLWRVPAAREADISHVNLLALSALQRALLVTGGTVGTFIEVITLESVAVVLLLRGEQQCLDGAHPQRVVFVLSCVACERSLRAAVWCFW